MGMVAAGNAFAVPGNHANKLVRALKGRKVQLTPACRSPWPSSSPSRPSSQALVEQFIYGLVCHFVFDDGQLVVAHAGMLQRYHGRPFGRVRSFALYGQTTGETHEYGLPVRYPWAATTVAARRSSTATPPPVPTGSTTPFASTPVACSAAGSPRCVAPNANSSHSRRPRVLRAG